MAYRILRVVICRKAAIRAMRIVKEAVKSGRLPNLKKRRVQCADCEKRAVAYDHRHYSKPLQVAPVCRGHNSRRGFALDQKFKDAITGEPRTVEEYRAERCRRARAPADRILSAFVGRPDYLREGAERADWHNMTMRGRRHAGRERRNEYLNAEHEYRLMHGHKDTGYRKIMTGLEALRLNRAAEQAFITAIDADKSKRMYRWCLAVRLPRAA